MVDKPSSELLSATIGEPQDEMGDVIYASVGQVHLLSHLWRKDEEAMVVGEGDGVTWKNGKDFIQVCASQHRYLS